MRDSFSEESLHIFRGVGSVLDHVVEEGCGDSNGVQPDLLGDYLGDGYRVENIRLATAPALPFVGVNGSVERQTDEFGVVLGKGLVADAQQVLVSLR